MNKEEAKNLVVKTFEQSFDDSRFLFFIKNLLNDLDESKAQVWSLIPESYRSAIKSYKRIGQYKDKNKNVIDILTVNVKRDNTLERARTLQRNFIARHLKQRNHEAALVAFYTDDYKDWRFSLVIMELNLTKSKVEIELSPAKRYSFLVGINERSHTAQNQFVNLLSDKKDRHTLSEIEEAFNIETVTKEFFLAYRNLFIRTKESLDKILRDDPKVKQEFETKGVDSVNFSKKLLGQIVFLYFLQKKGWFGVGLDDQWGEGSKKFLSELSDGKHCKFNNFFNDILEPLFYDALRNDRTHDDHYYPLFKCRIPFLNGGLFDPIGDYDWVNTEITLPNKLFSNSDKTNTGDIGDGILDIFDRYNFTVIEDEPLEKEVAIDPELLGKAYEKFNAIRPDNFDEYLKVLKSSKKGEETRFNKQYGVYYTPREIVHYMCRESLINYLASEFNDKSDAYQKIDLEQLDAFGNTTRKGQLPLEAEYKSSPYIPKADIETLINYGELLGENEAVVEAKGRETDTYYYKLPDPIRKNSNLIDEKLSNILICDPAVGSGAFPVGMMHEIVTTRNLLSLFIKDTSRSIYQFKRECIEKSLYGVDIDPGAVEIAKLRLWLSLVVDEEDINNIKPLPNLDYKVICGNSLLGVEKNIFNNELFEQLEKIKPLHFNETNPTKKQDYKKQIDELILKITNGHREFDFQIYFSEVFHQFEGFDIVIGNPPYGTIMSSYFNRVNIVIKSYISEMKDIYKAFFILSLNIILKKRGILTFITPNTYYRQKKYLDLRKFLSEFDHKVHINLGDGVFDSVVPTSISVIQNSVKGESYYYHDLSQENKIQNNFSELLRNSLHIINQGDLIDKNNYEIRLPIRMNDINDLILDSILECRDAGIQYTSDVEKVKRDNVLPIVKRIMYSNILSQKENEQDFDLIIGKNIDKYYLDKKFTHFLRFNYRHKIKKKYAERIWFSQDIMEAKERIIWRQTSDKIIAAYDTSGFFFKKSVHCGIIRNEYSKRMHYYYILSLLNSKYLNHLYMELSNEKGRIFAQVKLNKIRQLPIPDISMMKQQPFINLVEQIIKSKEKKLKSDIIYLEGQIDIMVYKLYNLTYKEVKIIDPLIEKIISEEQYERYENI